MAKKPIKKPDLSQPEYINLIKDIDLLSNKVSSFKKDIDNDNKKLNDKIDTIEGKIEGKLDGVDESLRGNGRIGLFEQMRNTKWKFKVIFICIFLLFGFKFFGRSLEDLLGLIPTKTTPVEKIETPVKKSIRVNPNPYIIEGKDPQNGARVIDESLNKKDIGDKNDPNISTKRPAP